MSLVIDVRDAFCLHPVPDGAVAALRGLTLAVRAGEKVLVHGPNGSGKTTLLRVLAGEQPLSAGTATVAGVDVGAPDAAGMATLRRQRLGWVDQVPGRMLRPELGVLDNVALQQQIAGTAGTTARRTARRLLDLLDVAHLAGQPVATLSGGEAARVGLCAALAHEPAVLLADEPTGQLDAGSAAAVYDALAQACGRLRTSLVLVSHDAAAARVVDRVVRIRDGRISESWSPGEPERLVVDDRGWVRLPQSVRLHAGTADPTCVSPTPVPGGVLLRWDAGQTAPIPARSRQEPAAATPGFTSRPAPPRASSHPAPLLRARGLSKFYDRGRRSVLRGVDLDVEPGVLHVLRGRSGSGKTTLLRLLVGLERPDGGSVWLDGHYLNALDRTGLARCRRDCVAVVGQEIQLAETVDVRTNIDLALTVRGLPADAVATQEVVDLLHLTPFAHRQVRQLSGGERQRCAVARALVVPAPLVVLDEPTSQLDEASAEHLAHALRAIANGGRRSVLVASHDPVLVAAAGTVTDLES